MSISVKSISLGINGTLSNKFNIELDGAKYRLDEFKLTQKLLKPCRLKFKLRKDPAEDISEIQFTACSSMIGKPVTLTLQTDSIEQQIVGFAAGSQNADVEFEGFVTNARAVRRESEYVIEVTAETKDTVMNDSPDRALYNEQTLSAIVNDVLQRCGVEGSEVQPKFEDQIFFTVQYNETNYQFLQRLAARYGEWMFNNGKKLHFGKLTDQESIVLAYPSQDLPEYGASLQTYHMLFGYMGQAYNNLPNYVAYSGTDIEDTGNPLNDAAFAASKENYTSKVYNIMGDAGLESDDVAESVGDYDKLSPPVYQESPQSRRQGRRANMLVYEGKTYCSKMKIGAKLTIKDNYINGNTMTDKSEVQQDEILITEVEHRFTIDEQYSNTFRGVTAAIDYPPYLDRRIHPVCHHPVRGVVKDTEDPKHWGRVRLRIPLLERDHGPEDKKYWTPWVHVAQPYTNGSKERKIGMHLIPEINSVVFVDFEEGNMERPFVREGHFEKRLPVDDEWYPGDNNVKAIRTTSGHTIEIHDKATSDSYQDGGYIRIYDNQTHYYEVLLSTDEKLIRLRSKGNIEMYADRNIIMKAGNDIKVEAGNDYDLHAGNEYRAKSDADMWLTTDKILTTVSQEDTYITTKADRHDNVQGRFQTTVEKDYVVHGKENIGLRATKKLAAKAQDVHLEAENSFKEYSVTQDLNATESINMTATATIDIKAAIIKEN